MKCPKCQAEMRVIRSIVAGDSAKTQHLECANTKCCTTGTAIVFFLNIDPGYGQGAKKVAQDIKEGKIKMPKIKKLG